jgi:CheY-like chemotaxis protein
MSAGHAHAQGVLLVDDDEDIREAVAEVIDMVGCSVQLAENGAEALVKLRQWKPCVVIVDLRMPVMTGDELIAIMKQDPELASLPIVVSTSSPERAPRGLPVLPKPIDIDALWKLLGELCSCAKV